MGTYVTAALAAGLAIWAFIVWRGSAKLKRAEFIRRFSLPQGHYDKVRKQHPQLELKDCSLVARGLRQYFLAYLNSGCKFVSMPSQVVDDLWHEFILYTREYEQFCRKAFGGFLHHVPAAVLGPAKLSNEGLRRVWWYACKEENTNPKKPVRLPLLFALDAKLKIANGFDYAPDCKRTGSRANNSPGILYCGGDFASSSIDGCIDGFGSASSAPSFAGIRSIGIDFGGDESSGCDSGGCGGGGCGGGD